MITDPTPYKQKIDEIKAAAFELDAKFTSGDFTRGDLAQLADLWSQYAETLDEILIEGVSMSDNSTIIQIENGAKIKFKNDDALHNYLTSLMHPTE